MTAPRAFFVTGTDTGVGKTYVCLALMASARMAGLSVVGLKPVASGCDRGPQGPVSQDALRLMSEASVQLPYRTVNPWAFEAPIAPHLAAAGQGTRIDLRVVEQSLARARATADLVVVEGIGGWLAPLTETATVADMVCDLGLPVVLVVGLRLGCLNHALLTSESIAARGLSLIGWVANELTPRMLALDENVAALQARLCAPLLGRLPYAATPSPQDAAGHLRLPG